MPSRFNIDANGLQVEVRYGGVEGDFISLTDIAKYRTIENPGYIIQNWMRTRSTVRFLGLWEHFHNPDFNYLEFEAIEREAGLNSFVLTPKRWVEQTRAKGIVTKQGRYAATFAHQDIAFEFASWISPDPDLEKDFYLLRHTLAPAVLVENLFMDNPADCAFLLSPEGQRSLVDLHVDGIIRYLQDLSS